MKKIVHPGTLMSTTDMTVLYAVCNNKVSTDTLRMAKQKVFNDVKLDCKSQALPTVDIGKGGNGIGHKEFTEDGKQAYGQALAYIITRNEKYATNCMTILGDWAQKCSTFKGSNAPLEAAWGTAAMSRACELLKYVVPNWQIKFKHIEQLYVNWVRKILMPHLLGQTEKYKLQWGFYNNWHTSILEAKLQFAILTNEIEVANNCIEEYKTIFASYVQDNGFTGETLRDSDHCTFGLAGLIQICELAHHQGIDLYSLNNNLLHKSIEFHADLYGNKKVPDTYTQNLTQFNICNWIQPSAWEIARKHFCERKKMKMQNTDSLLEKIRPCGYALHWGYCTLTHYCTCN